MMNTITLSNQVRCLLCHTMPFSRHTHDYVSCNCGNVAVDGGRSMGQRIIYKDPTTWEDMSINIWEGDYYELQELLKQPLNQENADLCCDVFIEYMKYPQSIKSSLLPAANWAIRTLRNSIGLICAFARTYRDGEFLS